MTLISWTDAFLTNIAEIDAQHRTLVDMVNRLHAAVRAGRDREALAEVLAGLIAYTRTHFAHEERLMSEHGYPEFAAHKAEHDRLTGRVMEFERRFREEGAPLTIELIIFLHDWLLKHILTVDRRYGPFLNARGVS